jgi:hypothetical protein
MDNRPLIRLSAHRIQPDYEDRFRNWLMEVYYPLLITVPEYKGIDTCRIVKDNPQYERYLHINYYRNQAEALQVRQNPKVIDITKDLNANSSRIELVWFAAYELLATFNREKPGPGKLAALPSVNAPIINIEGYSIHSEDPSKFETWLTKWGYELYVPWLVKLPGLKEYSLYKQYNLGITGLTDVYKNSQSFQYPTYLSIVRFENIASYENYEKSIELAGFREAIRAFFTRGLDFKWYVQYQLLKSFRK